MSACVFTFRLFDADFLVKHLVIILFLIAWVRSIILKTQFHSNCFSKATTGRESVWMSDSWEILVRLVRVWISAMLLINKIHEMPLLDKPKPFTCFGLQDEHDWFRWGSNQWAMLPGSSLSTISFCWFKSRAVKLNSMSTKTSPENLIRFYFIGTKRKFCRSEE